MAELAVVSGGDKMRIKVIWPTWTLEWRPFVLLPLPGAMSGRQQSREN